MDKDQATGALILVLSLIGIVVYGALLYWYPTWTLQVSAFLAGGTLLAILAWIGYTLATTPPPKPIEEIEKEVEKELEEMEKGSKAEKETAKSKEEKKET